MILITSTGRLRQKDSPIVETSWATKLRSCLKNATHSQKPKPITLITRVKVPGHAWKRPPGGAAAAPSGTAYSPHCWPGCQHHLQMGLGSQHCCWDWQHWKQVAKLCLKGLETYSCRKNTRYEQFYVPVSASSVLSQTIDNRDFPIWLCSGYSLSLCWFRLIV